MSNTHTQLVLPESEAIVIAHAMNFGTSFLKETAGDSSLPEWLGLPSNKTIYRAVETLERHGVIPCLLEVSEQLQREGSFTVVESCLKDAVEASGIALNGVAEQELTKVRKAYIRRETLSTTERASKEKWSATTTQEKLAPLATLEETGKGASLLDGIQVHKAGDLIDKPIDEGQTLLGNRFLCRGGGLFLVGPSGVGKSTLTLGLAAAFGAGIDYLGISPSKPLKTLIVQAENDEGDVIEQIRGAYGSDREGIENLHICPIGHLVGVGLIEAIDRLIKRHAPDIMILDCLHAYLGDDAKESKALGIFLRQLLNPVIKRHGVGAVIVHHTPKTSNQDRTNWNPSDYQYAAAGGAEIANWCRSMLVLEATDVVGVFRLVAAKRGGRIGGEVWKNGWVPIRHSDSTAGGLPTLRWEVAEGIDLAMIKRAALEKKAAKQSYQCCAGDFIAQLPEAGNGKASCMKSGDLRGILQMKKFCSKDGFGGLKVTYTNDGVIKTLKVGTTEWVGRAEDIDQMEQEGKSCKS